MQSTITKNSLVELRLSVNSIVLYPSTIEVFTSKSITLLSFQPAQQSLIHLLNWLQFSTQKHSIKVTKIFCEYDPTFRWQAFVKNLKSQNKGKKNNCFRNRIHTLGYLSYVYIQDLKIMMRNIYNANNEIKNKTQKRNTIREKIFDSKLVVLFPDIVWCRLYYGIM